MENKGKNSKGKNNKEKIAPAIWFPKGITQNALLLLQSLLNFSFPPLRKIGSLLSFSFSLSLSTSLPHSLPPTLFSSLSLFLSVFCYIIHAALHSSTVPFHSPEDLGHVCGIQVHVALSFPVTYAYCHQRPNSWVSNFLARYTCCPALHRSCCLFWFCVIIYCLQCELCSFKEKGLAYVFFPINVQWIVLTAEWWDRAEGRELRGCVCVSGQFCFSGIKGRAITYGNCVTSV